MDEKISNSKSIARMLACNWRKRIIRMPPFLAEEVVPSSDRSNIFFADIAKYVFDTIEHRYPFRIACAI